MFDDFDCEQAAEERFEDESEDFDPDDYDTEDFGDDDFPEPLEWQDLPWGGDDDPRSYEDPFDDSGFDF